MEIAQAEAEEALHNQVHRLNSEMAAQIKNEKMIIRADCLEEMRNERETELYKKLRTKIQSRIEDELRTELTCTLEAEVRNDLEEKMADEMRAILQKELDVEKRKWGTKKK